MAFAREWFLRPLVILALGIPMSSHVHGQAGATGPALGQLQALRAALGGQVSALCGTGTVTFFGANNTTSDFPIHICATHQSMRSDTSLPKGVRSAIFDSKIGVVRTPDGHHFRLSGRNAYLWRPVYFPPLLLDSLLADDQLAVLDHAETDSTDQGPHLHLRWSELFNKSSRIPPEADDVSLHVDASKQTVTVFSWQHSSEGKGMQYAMHPVSVSYSNYISVDGRTLPQTVTTSEFGRTQSIIHFASFQINPSLERGFFSLTPEEFK